MTNSLSQRACGKLYISKNVTISINDQTYNLHHGVDAMLESGQIFRTISDTISTQANNIVINIPIILDHQIKVVLKTQNNEIICVKYIGALGKRTALNNIYLSSEDLKIRGINERILLSIYSVCNFITPECCGLLPSFNLTNTITSACVLVPPVCDLQYSLNNCISFTTTTTTIAPQNYCEECPGNLIQNGNFEAVIQEGSCFGGGVLQNWNQLNIDIHARQYCNLSIQDLNRYVDLNECSPGYIEQSFATSIGQSYRVTFLMQGNWVDVRNSNRTLTVSAAGQSAPFSIDPSTYTLPTWPPQTEEEMGWGLKEFIFTANNTTTTLRFQSTSNTFCYGPVIDCVCVKTI